MLGVVPKVMGVLHVRGGGCVPEMPGVLPANGVGGGGRGGVQAGWNRERGLGGGKEGGRAGGAGVALVAICPLLCPCYVPSMSTQHLTLTLPPPLH